MSDGIVYAVIYKCKEARYGLKDRTIITREGDEALLCIEPEGWVPATSRMFREGCGFGDAVMFGTEEAAHTFMEKYRGHPWYSIPSGEYRLVALKPKFRLVPDGYELAAKGESA